MKKKVLIGGLALLVSVTAAGAFTGEKYIQQAKITLDQARSIALQAQPGVITDQELERERGGSGLRYSFDIRNGTKTYEVGVDAKSGRLLENKREGAHPD